MSNPRTFYQCTQCPWILAWSFMPPGRDDDPGLMIAQHMEVAHPWTIYGDATPRAVLAKILRANAPPPAPVML